MKRVCEAKIIKEVGGYKIVELYSNIIEEEGENPYIGDIYETKPELKKDHPNSKILTGYGIIDDTGYSPSNTLDWYSTSEKAESYILEYLI